MALDFSSQAAKTSGPLDFSAAAAPADPSYAAALADARKREANPLSGGPLIRNFARGASLGFNDELDAASAAGETAIHGLFNRATGQKPLAYTAKDAFDAVMEANKEAHAADASAHPFQTGATELAGGIASPAMKVGGGLIKGASSLASAAKRSAGIGAALGSITGAGTTDGGLIDRAKGAGVGLIAGGTFGAAAPVAVRGAVGLINRGAAAASEAGSSLVRAMTGSEPGQVVAKALSPQAMQSAKDRALSYVADLAGRSGRTLADLESHPGEALGKPVLAAEALGRGAMYQLQTLGKRAGLTPDALEGTLEARRLDAPNRLTGDIATSLDVHPDAAKGSIDTLVSQGQAKASPLYTAALADPKPVTNPTLAALSQRPVIQRALRNVAASMMNAGQDPSAHGLEVTGANEAGLPETVKVRAPTAETWDRVKKAVGGLVERHPITNKPLPNSVSAGNADIAVASRDLTGALREAIPGYGDALDASGDYLSHAAAFDRVRGAVFKTQTTAADFGKMWSGFSPSQADAARASIANDFHNLAQNGRLKPQLFNTPSVRAKLTAAFGPDKTQALIARVEQEALLAKGQRMTPGTNSTTGESAFAGDEQDQAGQFATGLLKAGGHAAMGDGRGAVRGLIGTVGQVLAPPVRGAMTPLAQASRDEVGRLLQLKPSELAAELRQFASRAPKPRVGVRAAPVAASSAGGYAASAVNNP